MSARLGRRKLYVMSKTSFLGDKPVNRIGFGAMQLAGPGVFGAPSDPEGARAVLRRAIELGVDHIDTSQFYGPNVVNQLIREALYPYPEHLKLATKVGGRRDDAGGWLPAQSPADLRVGVEDNLRTLQLERIDLVNLRLFDEHDAEGRLAEQLGALEDLRQEGKLDLIGISNASADTARRALELVDIACVQNAYSVQATPSQIALAWLLHRSERILLIPGTSSIQHLEGNIAAGTSNSTSGICSGSRAPPRSATRWPPPSTRSRSR